MPPNLDLRVTTFFFAGLSNLGPARRPARVVLAAHIAGSGTPFGLMRVYTSTHNGCGFPGAAPADLAHK